MRDTTLRATVLRRDASTAPVLPVPDPPSPHEDSVNARYEADAAKAEAARVKRELDELKKNLPTDEQKARWAELEAAAAKAEDDRKLKAGEYDALRRQQEERHTKELEAERAMRENVAAQQRATEEELVETLVGAEFANASDLFGPAGSTSKTVLIPQVAQSYFRSHIDIEVVPGVGGSRASRRVVVKDRHGATIMDPKTGRPMPFAKAMEELIDSHPQRDSFLRGSGKSGSNSPGGAGGTGNGPDIRNLKSADFQKAEVRDAVRQDLATGGIKIGPAFDTMNRARRGK